MSADADGLRLVGPADLDEVEALLATDPWAHVLVDHRVRRTRLDPRLLGAEIWGWPARGPLESLCHAGANLIPVAATPSTVAAFAAQARAQGRRCAAILGEEPATTQLWRLLEPAWGPPRDVRPRQPFLVLEAPPAVAPDPRVRRAEPRDLDILYPAAVEMFTEEVGVSPETGRSGHLYRARVAQLVSQRLSFVWREADEVVFKAEVGALNDACAQVQGVWVNPMYRGQGLAAGAMAQVCRVVLDEIAPAVTLYVNEHNRAARRLYARLGFREHTRFLTVLF